jgi:predicted dehydrogenase
MRELRIGLVGAGWMGKVHSMSYRTARSGFGPEPAVPVLATIADVRPEIAERAARDFGYERAATDWRQIVDDPSIDIVDICTPNDLHFDIAMAAIAAGKHVNCEKPLANTLDHARQMAEAAKRKGVTTMVGFNYIQNPVHVLAREAIRRGDIGDVNHVRLFFVCDFMADANLPHTWRNDLARAGSGVIGDVGAHCLSYFCYLLDRRIEEVFCQLETVMPDHAAPLGDGAFRLNAAGDSAKRVKNTTDDIATVIFHFSDGGSGEMSLSRVATGIRYDIGYDISGTLGTVRYSYDHINNLQLYRPTGEAEFRGFTQIEMGPSDPRFAALHPVSGLGLGYNDYKAIEAREMIAAVAEGRPAFPDFSFGYRIQRVIEACQRSHETRAWVAVAD